MMFNEPKVEYVEIGMDMVTEGSGCTDASNQAMGSGEDCINASSPQNNCDCDDADDF